MIYWIVVIGGGAVAITGYILMFPFYGTEIAGMQWAQVIHGIVAVLFIAAMLGHIYIGTIGMEGAFEAMGTGRSTSIGPRSITFFGSQEEKARTGPKNRRASQAQPRRRRPNSRNSNCD